MTLDKALEQWQGCHSSSWRSGNVEQEAMLGKHQGQSITQDSHASVENHHAES